jgi:hypothetical protein
MRTAKSIKIGLLLLLISGGMLLTGCTKDLEEKVATLEQEKAKLEAEKLTKEQYVEEVMSSINEIQGSLDTIRAREGVISKASSAIEKPGSPQAQTIKQNILSDISDIDTYLQENKKKLISLQAKMKKYQFKIESLERMVENLQNTISQKEMEIAYLKEEISALNVKVASLETTIRQKDMMIRNKDVQLNRAYYVVGTWDELRDKGIIEDQGGFLWFGKTTVATKDFDLTKFRPISADSTSAITIDSPSDDIEILTTHASTTFELVGNGGKQTVLKIKDPATFWEKSKCLVVMLK